MKLLDSSSRNRRRFGDGVLWLCAVAVLGLASGCGNDNAGTDTAVAETSGAGGEDAVVQIDTATPADTPTTAPDAAADGKDALVLPDVPKGDTNDCPGGAGCSCTKNADCATGFCIDTNAGQQCAKKCDDSVCPDGFKCANVAISGGEFSSICVQAHAALCNPCTNNTQCQGPGNSGARCVSNGNGGAFCGESCGKSDDCAAGYECLDTKDLAGNSSKQCVVKNGGACTCSSSAMKNQLFTICYKETGAAKCSGKRICLSAGEPGAPAGGGLTDCAADVPEAEKCDGLDNDCDGQTDESACDDQSPCTDDTCDPKAGCSHVNNNGFCDADGSVCTKDDTCSNGKCLTGKPVNCDDNNPCTNDTCDPKAGCKSVNADGLGCNFDDNPCTVGDSCKDGKCAAGPPKACNTDEPCIVGKCNLLGDGKCEYKNKDGQPCEDGNPCTASDTCVVDVCQGKAADCDDKNSCTIDACDKKTGCTHSPASGACDDGDACTTKDTCAGGKCDGQVLDAAKYCNDNNGCTTDTCNPALGCVNKPANGLQCDDGNSCSVGDKCDTNGACISGNNTCACNSDAECAKFEDGNSCNGTLYCDKSGALSQCKVKLASIIVCDTGTDNPCKKTLCDPGSGKCVPQLQPDGLPCPADSNVCTVDDGCKAGACVPGKVDTCDDKNPCTIDTCDPATGCKHAGTAGACDADGDPCTVGDNCATGTCQAGPKKSCDDGNSCTEDGCDAKGACTNKPMADAPCSDGNECTIGDKCGADANGKFNCLPGKGPTCDDGNPCTVDTCDNAKGCKNTVDASAQALCYSGDPATKGKGICKPGVQNCDAQGKLGPCVGQVLPEAKDVCDGKDNDCDGVADPGCAPTAFKVHYANADVVGAGPNLTLRAVAGASNTGGASADSKNMIRWGFLAWLKAWLGK